jgi:hypothetical protein
VAQETACGQKDRDENERRHAARSREERRMRRHDDSYGGIIRPASGLRGRCPAHRPCL